MPGLLRGMKLPARALAAGLFLACLLAACEVGAPGPITTPIDVASPADLARPSDQGAATVLPIQAIQPPPTYTPFIQATAATTSPPTPRPTSAAGEAAPSPTPPPYAGLFIADLARREYGGGELEIVDTLEVTDEFTRYLITYPSEGLTIYGFMNVPNLGSRFPVVIALHGYIDPAQYNTLDYTTRYADALARAGYFVIHPNMRGFPPSDQGDSAFRVGLAVDILNLIAIIRQQSQDPTRYLRRADADDINLWGHSMGGGVVLRVITVNNSPYIRAAVLYGAMSGDERRNYEKIRQWSAGRVGDFELAASPSLLKAISPIYQLDRIGAAVSIHHGAADTLVPPDWSDDLCQRLQNLQKPVQCHTYAGMPHTFSGASEAHFMERVVAFFNDH